MRIYISAKPSSHEEKIEQIDSNHLKVFVKEPPVKGRANAAIIALLAQYFDVPKTNVQIVRGEFTKEKTVVIIQ
jgi:uncharacterized protein